MKCLNSADGLTADPTRILYIDETCGICRAGARIVKDGDQEGEVAVQSIEEYMRATSGPMPGELQCKTRSGTSLSGWEAVINTAASIPTLYWFARLANHPVTRPFAKVIYRIAVRNRYRLSRLLRL